MSHSSSGETSDDGFGILLNRCLKCELDLEFLSYTEHTHIFLRFTVSFLLLLPLTHGNGSGRTSEEIMSCTVVFTNATP